MMKLRDYIKSGWRLHIRGIMGIHDAPISQSMIENILKVTNRTATHIVFLNHETSKERRMYPICDVEELKYANKLAAEGMRIVGYSMRITCIIKSLDNRLFLGAICQNIATLLGVKAESIIDQMGFNIFYEIHGNDKKKGDGFLERLSGILLSISIKNRVYIEIINIQWGPEYAAQKFAIWAGLPESYPKIVTNEDVDRLCNLNERHKEIFLGLAEFYGQITFPARLIVGFGLLEKLFGSESLSHLLDDKALNVLLNKIEEIEDTDISIENKRILKLKLKDKNYFTNENRNVRLSKNLSHFLKEDESAILKKVRKISALRAVAAHSNRISNDRIKESKEACDFIENIILNYLGLFS